MSYEPATLSYNSDINEFQEMACCVGASNQKYPDPPWHGLCASFHRNVCLRPWQQFHCQTTTKLPIIIREREKVSRTNDALQNFSITALQKIITSEC